MLNIKTNFVKTSKRGFTLLEVVIVMAIMAVVFSFGYFVTFDFYKDYALQSEKDALTSVLRKARSQALNNVGETAHGVYLDNSSFILFYGSDYASRDSQFDEIITRSSGIDISGLNEIVFSPLSGTSTASGTMILSNGVKSEQLEINYAGRIEK